MQKVRWGILSTADIGINKVIPALQNSSLCEVTAIASRNYGTAANVATRLGIPNAYGSYEALLEDAGIDAVYIPLPNHLHVPWALKAIAAGKHVLCEKPIGLSASEGEQLLQAAQSAPGLVVMEAFMYRFHPQWAQIRELIAGGAIGELRTVQSSFLYYNNDPANIRNNKDWGGGGLMDIGCYCISLSRWLFGKEPLRAMGLVEADPAFGVDRLVNGVLDFGTGSASFYCSTQLQHGQSAVITGTRGRIELEIPFTPTGEKGARFWLCQGDNRVLYETEAVDQYKLQADVFAQSVLSGAPIPTPLQDAINNMKVIEAVFESGKTGGWAMPA